MLADNVVIHNYTTTFEGSSITFTCEDGLFPDVTITATCTGEGHWSPDPATYICINITGTTTGTTTSTINTTMDTSTASTTVFPVNCPANSEKGIIHNHNQPTLSVEWNLSIFLYYRSCPLF